MTAERIVYMANQIATFFETAAPASVADGVAGHINDFWEPRMRAALIAHAAAGGAGLKPAVLAALPAVRPPAAAA
ncbi:MAG: formate dehydrogenase subunit delta [Rhodobacteraceae bacterium]|jgi:formate dehydrogenase subunit delta|nr:formate dehydrogenase subunit delta [Paracoccaceae bacterium]